MSATPSIYNTDIRCNYLTQQQLLTAQQARKRVVENELRYTIRTAYYKYLQTLDGIRILDNSRRVLNELARLNEKLVSNNVATKEILTPARYELSKLDRQLAEATKNRESARAYFNFLLNRDLIAAVEINSLLNMPRGEDPEFMAPQFAVVVVYPGTDARDMEELVVDPAEKRFNELDNIDHVITTGWPCFGWSTSTAKTPTRNTRKSFAK